jgi:hypothetical protein
VEGEGKAAEGGADFAGMGAGRYAEDFKAVQ